MFQQPRNLRSICTFAATAFLAGCLAVPAIADTPQPAIQIELVEPETVELQAETSVVIYPAQVVYPANTTPREASENARPLLPSSFQVSNIAARIAKVAEERHEQGAAYSHRHYCQMLLRTTVERVTPAYSRYFSGTALKTMRAFQAAGIGQPYTEGMQLLPGDMLYTARMGGDYGHAMLVGPDGRIRDNVGSGLATPWQRKIDWVVRPSQPRLASYR